MKTEKLYYKNSFLSEFEATVLSCEKAENGYKIILDKTAFFPEGGGQPSDIGYIEDTKVSYVSEEGGEIFHYAENALEEGKTVCAKIDFKRRFSFMQNHSGEHIVSGIVNKIFGFNNVGFHLSERFVTLDFDGELNRNELDKVEILANKAIFENRKVSAFFPSESELENLVYRSKKEVEGPLRIVEIEGVDVCACCAPHIERTGQIGLIKLLDFEKMRKGTRIILKCGNLALEDYENKYKNIYQISNLLSVKQEETFKAVENLNGKLTEQKLKNSELKRRIIALMINFSDKEQTFFYEKEFDMKELQMLSDGLHKATGKTIAVFSGEEPFAFSICGEEAELGETFARFKSAFNVRGGGRGTMMQGSVSGDIKAIEEFFKG